MPWLCKFGLDNGMFMQLDRDKTTLGKFRTEKFNPFEAAMRYEAPQVIAGVDRVGWDGTGFQFRGAHLVDGVFHQNPEFKLPGDAPGREDGMLFRTEIEGVRGRPAIPFAG